MLSWTLLEHALVAAIKEVVVVVVVAAGGAEDTNLVSGDAPVELQSKLEVYRTAHQSMILLTSLPTMG